jgi:hypothetical protein
MAAAATVAAQGFCPRESAAGIIQLTMPLTAGAIAGITENTAPLTITFAAKRTAPTLIDGRIDEGTDNTLTYKGNKYTLTGGVQICRPTHTGYLLPDQRTAASAELYMPFVNPRVTGAYPTTVVLVVPIYQASVSDHAAYLKQLIDSSAPVASLQTVFIDNVGDKSQTSFGYQSCVDLVGAGARGNNTTAAFFYFPKGVSLTGQEYTKLMGNRANQLPAFRLPPAGRETLDTVREFRLVGDGGGAGREPVNSPEGILRLTQLSTGSEEFGNRFIYYSQPPRLGGKFSDEHCPYYKTSQYKCVPFDRLADLSGDYVIPGGAQVLKSILGKEDAVQAAAAGKDVTSDIAQAGIIVGGVAGGLAALSGLLWLVSWLTTNNEAPPEGSSISEQK